MQVHILCIAFGNVNTKTEIGSIINHGIINLVFKLPFQEIAQYVICRILLMSFYGITELLEWAG